MPRESADALRERALAVTHRLRGTYPDAHCELVFSNPLELLIATILSAQCSDRQVNRVTPALFSKYRTAADYAAAPLPELENDIRNLGLFRNKAKNIRTACHHLVDRHEGRIPQTLDELVELAGVGRKTANVVLGNAFNITSGIVVDTHVARLSNRLGFTRETDPTRIEFALGKLVPHEHWMLFSHWIIWHGRRRCTARSPDCGACEIRDLCPSASALKTPPNRRKSAVRSAAK